MGAAACPSQDWSETKEGKKDIEIKDLKERILKIREILITEREKLSFQLSAANEALSRAKLGGGK
jgi:hypothetical protein